MRSIERGESNTGARRAAMVALLAVTGALGGGSALLVGCLGDPTPRPIAFQTIANSIDASVPEPAQVICTITGATCTTSSSEVCCWESDDAGAQLGCKAPSACRGMKNACDGPEDCPESQICCQNLRIGASCKESCDPGIESRRCSVGPDGACPSGTVCASCPTAITSGSGSITVPICVAPGVGDAGPLCPR